MADAETYRSLVLKDLKSVDSYRQPISTWLNSASQASQGFGSGQSVLELGSHLREIFFATRGEGREGKSSQSQVARAGAGWECLIVWYLNLIFEGSRAVAVRKKSSMIAPSILDAISVNHGNFQTNSESDIIVIAAPKELAGSSWTKNGKPDPEFFTRNVHKLSVGVVQSKTNWNENSQIPMLWDMVYQAGRSNGQLAVGKNGYSIIDFRKFTYSFVTVPTQKEGKIPGPNSIHAKRVRHLSGGNYWGRTSVNDVAMSLKEIFTRNFAEAFDSNIAASVDRSLACGNPFILDAV